MFFRSVSPARLLCCVLFSAAILSTASGQRLERLMLPDPTPSHPYETEFDYYVDAAKGDDTCDGTSGNPWRSLDKAVQSAKPGSTIGVRTGKYGVFYEHRVQPRQGHLTLKATPGSTPVIGGFILRYPKLHAADLRIEGFEIYSESAMTLVDLKFAANVEIVGCTVHADKWARKGSGVTAFKIVDSSDILLERNRAYEVSRGVTASRTRKLTVRRNYLRLKAGTGVQYAGGNAGGVIEFNHLQGDSYVGFPENADAVKNPHASIISVRSGELAIRGNHMHGFGTSSGIMFYKPDIAGGEDQYNDVLIENNALYDVDNTYALRIYNLGNNFVVRNNLFFSRRYPGNCHGWSPDARYRYSVAMIVHNVATTPGERGLELYNNILLGIVVVPGDTIERHNIAWAWKPWNIPTPSKTTLVITHKYLGCDKHSRFIERTFFERAPDLTFPRGDVADWTLSSDSIGTTFGDPAVQPADSLGSIGPNGFVRDDGPKRSKKNHSVGPFANR